MDLLIHGWTGSTMIWERSPVDRLLACEGFRDVAEALLCVL